MASISGAAMEYETPRDFAGRYWAMEVELLTINITPAISYRVNDRLSLGFSVPVMLGSLDMDIAIPGPASTRWRVDSPLRPRGPILKR